MRLSFGVVLAISWLVLVLSLAQGRESELPEATLFDVTTIPLQWPGDIEATKMQDFFFHSRTGDMYVSDYFGKKIYRIDSQGIVSLVITLPYLTPYMVQSSLDPDTVYVSTANNGCLLRVNITSAQYDVFAGTCTTIVTDMGICHDGPLSNATMCFPFGLAQDAHGNLLVADFYGRRIRRIELDQGYLSTYAGTNEAKVVDGPRLGGARFYAPQNLLLVQDLPEDYGGSTLFVSENDFYVIRAINSTGWVSTYAGAGQLVAYDETDGPKLEAYFHGPRGMVMDKEFNLYVTDEFADTIRVVTNTGFALTVAGRYGVTTPVKNGPAVNATFNAPTAIGFAPFSKDLIVLDSNNKLIRRLRRCLLYLDQDRDGYGNSSISIETCDFNDAEHEGDYYVGNDLDCDDSKPAVNVMVRYYLDLDGDGYGNESVSMLSCYPLPPDSPWVSDDNRNNGGFDCDDNAPNVGPVCNQHDASSTDLDSPMPPAKRRGKGAVIAIAVTVPLLVLIAIAIIVAIAIMVVVGNNKRTTANVTKTESREEGSSTSTSSSGPDLELRTPRKKTFQAQIRINNDSFVIPYEQLSIVKKLGGGAFGIIFEGLWGETKVAVE